MNPDDQQKQPTIDKRINMNIQTPEFSMVVLIGPTLHW